MTRSDRRAGAATVLVLSVCIGAAVGLFFVGQASAAYTLSCSTPPGSPAPGEITDDAIETRNQRIEDAANCAALAERLEANAAATAAVAARLDALDDAAPGSAAQRVALSAKDRERLDLAWYGVWAIVGLTLVLLVSQKWYGAWRFLRE